VGKSIGKSGNDILNNALLVMRSEDFEVSIYGHPIGDWEPSAGTLIGSFSLSPPSLTVFPSSKSGADEKQG